MRLNLFFLLFILSVISYSSCVSTNSSQLSNKVFYLKKYESFLEKDDTVKVVDSGVNYTIEFNQISKKYIYKQYQPQKTVLLTYSEHTQSSINTNEGKFITYGDDGRIMQEGNYLNNEKVGFWQEFNEKGNYTNNQKQGIWYKFKVDNFGNLTDTILTKKYKNDVLIHEKLLDSSEILTIAYLAICKDKEAKDRNKCTEDNLLKAVYSNITYPISARETNIQGLTYSSFVVNENGQITDIKVIRSICNEMKAELIKSIKQLPKFNPGMINGVKKPIRFNLPVRFKLQR